VESPIKLLVLASIGLLSYGAEAALLEATNNQIIAWQNTANHSKASNHYASRNLSESGTLVLTSQLRPTKYNEWQLSDLNNAQVYVGSHFHNSDRTDLSYNTLNKSNEAYNPDNTDELISKNPSAMRSLKADLAAAGEFSMRWEIDTSNELISGHQHRLSEATDLIKLIGHPSYLGLISYKPLLRVPLPTATWLFLGLLLGFLRIQRRSVI
jgi:hypothetical protein